MKQASCSETREALLRAGEDRSRGLEEHLRSCPACAAFAARAAVAAADLGERRSTVIADPGFAARVVAALPSRGEHLLGWAALRFLPAAVALALVLGFWSWSATGAPGTLVEESPTDDLIGWVLESGVSEP